MLLCELIQQIDEFRDKYNLHEYEVFIQQKKIKQILFGHVPHEESGEFHITFVDENNNYI